MNMPVVEVAIGLAVVYMLMSILCSSAMEMIAGFLNLRGEMLWKGVESMLGGQGAGGLAARMRGLAGALVGNVVSGAPSPAASDAGNQVLTLSNELIDHPLVDSMRSGDRAPSYLAADRFATALLDTLGKAGQGGRQFYADLGSTVRALPDGPLKRNLELILKETGGDMVQVKQRIQNWYDDVMARVSGWYKRQTQWLLLLLGFVAATAMNVDSIDLAKRMWTEPMLRTVAVKSAEAYAAKPDDEGKGETAEARARKAQKELDALGASGMPIGWPAPWYGKEMSPTDKAFGVLGSLLGWAVTALAVSLGAPYWYELLLKLLPLARNSGGRPAYGSPSSSGNVGSASEPPPPAPPTPLSAPPMPFQNALNAFEASLTQDDVHEIQEELGLTGVDISGNLDQKTREAIMLNQAARGLTPSGELNSDFVGDLLRRRRTG